MNCRKRCRPEKSLGIKRFFKSLIWLVLLIVISQKPTAAHQNIIMNKNFNYVCATEYQNYYYDATLRPVVIADSPDVTMHFAAWQLHVSRVSKSGGLTETITKNFPASQITFAARVFKLSCVGSAYAFWLEGQERDALSATIAAGQASRLTAYADFDGDGIPDRARIASSNSVVVDLLAADDTIRPGKTSTIKLGTDIGYLEAADFNGDGKMDLAVSNAFSPFEQSGAGVFILLGKGDGTFQCSFSN